MKVVKISSSHLEAEVVCESCTSDFNRMAGTHVLTFRGVTKSTVWIDSSETESMSLNMIEVAGLRSLIVYDVVG